MRTKSILIAAVIAIFALQTGAQAKGAKSVSVNCSLPATSVQGAVDGVTPGVPTTIFVVGDCTEDVTITSDAITLSGDPNGLGLRGGDGTINGQISVIGANNVTIENLTVTGSGAGVVVQDSANVHIRDSILDENEFEGVAVINAAFVEIGGTDIIGNSTSGGSGLVVQRNSAAVLVCNNVITGNGANNGRAIFLEEGGALRQQKCATGERDIITAVSGGVAIFIFNGSVVDIRGADVSGPITVYGGSTFRAQLSSLDGDVNATVGSLVGFRATTSFDGTLNCDASSQIFGSQSGLDAVQCGQTCTSDTPGTCSGP